MRVLRIKHRKGKVWYDHGTGFTGRDKKTYFIVELDEKELDKVMEALKK